MSQGYDYVLLVLLLLDGNRIEFILAFSLSFVLSFPNIVFKSFDLMFLFILQICLCGVVTPLLLASLKCVVLIIITVAIIN